MNRPEPVSANADGRRGSARRPVWYMLASVVCYAGVPLTIYLGVQTTSPLLFVAVGYLLSVGIFAAAVQMPMAGASELTVARLLSAMRPRYLLSLAVLKCDWFLFAGALALAPAGVVTILFEMWPVLFAVLCLSRWWRKRMHSEQNLDRSAAAATLTFMTVGIAGVALAVLSDAGSQSWSWSATVGVVLAGLSSATSTAAVAAEQLIGARQRDGSTEDPADVSAAGTVLARGMLGGAVLVVVVAWRLAGGPLDVSWEGLGWAAAAATLQTGGTWLYHRALHLARDIGGQSAPQINSLYYLVPVGAVILLAWLADSAVARPDLLICGVAGVVAVNMVMHLDPEGADQRAHPVGGHGYKALVLAVWVCGTAVVLRDDWLPESWQVWSVVEYWGMVGVLATVFVLMLSFRQSRLGERRHETDLLTLRLHQTLETMRFAGTLTSDAVEAFGCLRVLDTASRPSVLSRAYLEMRKVLLAGTQSGTAGQHAAQTELAAVRRSALADVEALTNLRQQDRNFAELAALTMFAAVTVALTLTARPAGDVVPFAGLAHDTASLVVAAAFAFLGFDLIDKRREADAPLFRQVTDEAAAMHGQPPGWRLEMVAYYDRGAERIVASLLGAALLAGAVVMLAVDWLA